MLVLLSRVGKRVEEHITSVKGRSSMEFGKMIINNKANCVCLMATFSEAYSRITFVIKGSITTRMETYIMGLGRMILSKVQVS